MTAIATTLLQILALLAPALSSSSEITKVISALEQIIPVVIQEAQGLVTPVRNIIAALQANGAVTADQVAQLAAQEATLDAAFDAAASADGL